MSVCAVCEVRVNAFFYFRFVVVVVACITTTRVSYVQFVRFTKTKCTAVMESVLSDVRWDKKRVSNTHASQMNVSDRSGEGDRWNPCFVPECFIYKQQYIVYIYSAR